jgi:hypothetical protein
METKIFKLKDGRFYLKAYERQGLLNYVDKRPMKRLIIHHTTIGPEDETYEGVKQMYNQQEEERSNP